MSDRRGPPTVADILGGVLIFVACFGVAAVGGEITAPAIPGWHAHLAKPPFNPPNWVFGPVWTALYFFMALAASLVWLRRDNLRTPGALALFLTQLALNLAWSFLFFGWHRIDLASWEIVALVMAICATLGAFLRISLVAGLLLAPYLAWTIFASALCWDFWHLNP